MTDTEVAIVGGGVAGCAAAMSASRAGIDAILFEARSESNLANRGRSFQAIQNLSLDTDALELFHIHGFGIRPVCRYKEALIHGPFGSTVHFRLDRAHGYFVTRGGDGSLEAEMLRTVYDSGVEIKYGSRAIHYQNGIKTSKGRVSARTTIGTDGIGTSIGEGIVRRLGLSDIALGIGGHYRGDHAFEPGRAECWLGGDLCPGEYAYVLASKDEVSVVTTMRPHLIRKGLRPDHYFRRFLTETGVGDRLEGARLVNPIRGCVPVHPGKVLGWGDRLLAGEAARLTDPLLGFGIINALVSGGLAGSSAAFEDPLKYYERSMKGRFDLDRRMRVRRTLDGISDSSLEKMLTIIKKVMENGGDKAILDREKSKSGILRSLAMLGPSDICTSLRLLLPLVRANFSL